MSAAAEPLPPAAGRRLDELAERHGLAPAAHDALARLLGLVAADARAPTAISDPLRAVDAHVADALAALELEPVRAARSVADMGSGAGFPGLVLAVALPLAEVALVEASARKCAFLERAVATTGAANATVVCARVEQWRAGLGTRDLVTARALAALGAVVEYAAPLLSPGGALVAWKGRRDAAEEADAAAAAAATGLRLAEVRRARPWRGAENLHLHLYLKVRSTPNRYPRAPGRAVRRPLRA